MWGDVCHTHPIDLMKTSPANIAMIALAALLVGFAIPQLSSVEVPQTTTIVPQVNAPPVEQYLVVDTSRVPVGSAGKAAPTLEAILNEAGAQGWRVRSTLPPFVIFAR
jgi:hypothetical protein